MDNTKYALEKDRFILEDYDRLPAFSGFLPGLAGVRGIPLWSFYTNRGQGISSFGIHNKANAMMEFNSAVTGYENTTLRGFRTFVRADGAYFEPFADLGTRARRRMEIEKNVLSVTEESHGLRFTVRYFILPGEDIGALVREVTVENLGEARHVELLDGMPQIILYGISNGQYKEMANLYKSWADIKNLEHNAPIYTMRASSDDSAEVSEIRGGWYYCAVRDGALQTIVYDKSAVFGQELTMRLPEVFAEGGLKAVLGVSPCFANKVPCAFVPIEADLGAGEKLTFTAFAGFAASERLLNRKTADFCREGYVSRKLGEAREAADALTRDVRTYTSDPVFDQYIEQCYMDNFLRGGYPFVFGAGEEARVLHLFSRKHGDPERDYNFFSIAGEYYSQGNGNYRDVCQNRRLDVFFNPRVGDFDVRQFYDLIQIDGYNPLEIRPSTFVLEGERLKEAKELLRAYLGENAPLVEKVISAPFTPGAVTNTIAARELPVAGDESALVERLVTLAQQREEAGFGEGYWSDHWDYNLDLVENYLLVYPEKKARLLFDDGKYRFYDSVGVVRPRRDTCVLAGNGVRQYGAVERSEEKRARPGFDENGTNWLKDRNGAVVTTSLFGKMLTLAVNKFALLDPEGLGVEMEGGKPGWNDAMNGLPGLFGSSMPETLELRRLVTFMVKALREQEDRTVAVPEELAELMDGLYDNLSRACTPFDRWDRAASLREELRERTKLTVSGARREIGHTRLLEVLTAFSERLDDAVERAMEIGQGIMPTYFTYEATAWEKQKDPDGADRMSPYGLPAVKVFAFRRVDVPYFLEGPARMLADCRPGERERAREMCAKIRETDLYDKKLKMYKTSASIEDLSMEYGRVRAFTPGWLERESIFLHMEYKYLLGMLKAGLRDEFYDAAADALIPYLDPAVYKRSTLENSSFLASSANPDPSVHGQGFVGRLSGSTAEMLTMWLRMFLGRGGFVTRKGALGLRLAPELSGQMFDEKGDAAFTLCGKCRVVYHNPLRKNTYGVGGARVRYMTVLRDGLLTRVEGDTLPEELALAVREGEIERIDAWLTPDRQFPFGRAVCYSGYRRGQSPRDNIVPSEAQIGEDLDILVSRGFSFIRMYDPNEHAERVVKLIRERGLPLRCMVGMDPAAEFYNPGCAWARRQEDAVYEANRARNDRELDKLIDLANRYPDVIIALSVGNENRPGWGSDLVEPERLLDWALKLRGSTGQMVTYTEGAPEWPRLPELAEAVDFISIHSYPLWNRVGVADAVAFNEADYEKIRACYPDKQIIFTECGWATRCNDAMDKNEVSEENQAAYIQKLLAWADGREIPVFLFEAFDEPWKGSEAEDEPEKHWGIFNEDRTPKKAGSLFGRTESGTTI